MTMYCEICMIRCESQQPWLDHLAGKKHRANLFRMKTEEKSHSERDHAEEMFIVHDEVGFRSLFAEEEPEFVKLEETAQLLQQLKGHVSQAQCRLNYVGAAAILLVAFVISSTWWLLGVRAESGVESPGAWNSLWWIVLYLIVGWQLGKAVSWIKTSVERIVENFNQRVISIERSVANVGVNIEQQVQNAGIQIQLSVEQKVAEVEAKVSAFVAPAVLQLWLLWSVQYIIYVVHCLFGTLKRRKALKSLLQVRCLNCLIVWH